MAAVFILAVFVFGYVTNKDNNDMTADMGSAQRPQITFSYNGYAVNLLPVYVKEMDITGVRDTITPVAAGRLDMDIKAYENIVNSLTYSVYTLDGSELLFEDTVKEPGETVSIELGKGGLLEEERVLKIVLQLEEEKEAYLYTRIADAEDKNVLECLDYIHSFHENALSKAEDVGIGAALEPNEESDNTTMQHVTIHSDFDHVTWGELEPEVEGGERWSIKEMNSTCMSVQLTYRVRCKGEENEEDVYNVKEFFRVRHVSEGGKDYLLDYDRTMEQVFDASHNIVNENGIILGITGSDVPYMVNRDNTIVSFIQADELWSYNKDTNEVSLLFSFADAENTDTRNLFPQHEVKLLEMDEEGNTVFAVYGYMNRGEHEGETGVAVYNYNIEQNSVEEKVFISGNRSYERVIYELGEFAYFSIKQNLLYLMSDGVFYEIDVDRGRKKELAKGLSEKQYVISRDGHIAAYYTEEDESEGAVVVKDLAEGTERKVECGEGESIIPLGFIKDDFVYGAAREADIGQTVSGQKVTPMYRIEIEDMKGSSIKTYEQKGIYILDASFEENMATLSRARRKGNVYTSDAEEYITNNEEQDESTVYAESYVTELKETQMRLVYEEGLEGKEPKLLKPKQTLGGAAKTVSFDKQNIEEKCYVYALGRLQGIYESAGEAVREADDHNGTVISAWQTYIWERGNRDLEYVIPYKDGQIADVRSMLTGGVNPVQIMDELSDGKSLDLTGCSVEQLLYIINQGFPVIAMTSTTNSVVLVGYSDSLVVYEDASGGGRHSVSYEQMESMTEKSGNTYVGRLK